MPTRLLDLDSSDNSYDVKLISSREDPPDTLEGFYMTLSHCWGKAEVLKLTENTIDMLRAGISTEQLPILYQEAVNITRKLGIRYLWIDSLCIVQDQKSSEYCDWLREASTMAKVYGNSYCNIAAMDAKDSLGNCFFDRKAEIIRPQEVIVEWQDNSSMFFYLIDERLMETGFSEDKPLSKRAWVLQEQLLAPRTLVFGKTQVYWQCRTHTACEAFPLGLPDSVEGQALLKKSTPKRPLHFLKQWVAATDPFYCFFDWRGYSNTPWESFWFNWKTVLEEYNRRSLTFSKDKLAAIAGIASELDRKESQSFFSQSPQSCFKKSSYIAGLWNGSEIIEYELLWAPKKIKALERSSNSKPCCRSREYIAPSWSWASVEGEIEFTYKQKYSSWHGDSNIGRVRDAEVITTDGTPTGPIKSGWIEVEGPLIQDSVLYATLDDESVPPPKAVYYLGLFEIWDDRKVWGLSLARIARGPNKGYYERIGTFSPKFCPSEFEFDDLALEREYEEFIKWTEDKVRLVRIV
jgi:hypothetical protein